MDARQETKLSMYDAVIQCCQANAAITATLPAFVTALNIFIGKVDSIKNAAQIGLKNITGVSLDKKQAKDILIKTTVTIANAMYAMATRNRNLILQQQVNTNYTKLHRTRDEQLPPACRIIYDLATANSVALVDYGITAATLVNFDTVINNYRQKIAAPRNAISLRSASVKSIADTFSQADQILKERMDHLIVLFKTTNVYFYNTYKNNRIIIDTPAARTKFKTEIENISASLSNATGGTPFSPS